MNVKKIAIICIVLLCGNNAFAQDKKQWHFDLSNPRNAVSYTSSNGAGFDFNTNNSKKDTPFYFSTEVKEGNYLVTVTLSSIQGTTVKAESRRLMLENVKTKANEFVTKSFVVNIKDRKINAKDTVKLKERELTKLDWDHKLTLEFDQYATVKTISIKKVDDQITVFLAGNSTVVNGDTEPWAAWGQMIPRFFKPGVAISNHAESGLTLGSFLASKRLDKIISIIKPGDYLFIEFGHNDQKDKGPNDGAYKAYTARLKLYVAQAKAKGGIPVIVTPTSRRKFSAEGKMENTLGDFPDAARKVATAEQVVLIDLNQLTETLFNAMGDEPSKKAFVHYPANTYPGQDKPLADNTHFSPYGAYEIARCLVEGIKNTHLPLADFLMDPKQKFDPARPDDIEKWKWPESIRISLVKPDGN